MYENQGFKVKLEYETPIILDRKDIAVLLFQSTRELLLNAFKHSGEKSAVVKIEHQNGNLRIIVMDRGIGFDAEGVWKDKNSDQKFGLITIRERLLHLGGRFKIESASNGGTTISLEVPRDVERLRELASC